jgi:hypothetical protein
MMSDNKLDYEEVSQFYDLTNRIARSVVAVIDTMVQRGAFRGEELSTIGQLRDQSIQAVQQCEAFQSQSSSE